MPSMTQTNAPEKIEDREGLNAQLQALIAHDPRLDALCERVDDVPLRLEPGGFAGMARIVNAQLLSVQSARAIFARLAALPDALCATGFVRLSEDELRGAGLSGGKIRTLRGLAEAELNGVIDYNALLQLEAEPALKSMMAHRGIGQWTAEIYLLFCAGHGDIFPAGDLALRKMVGHVTGLSDKPDIGTTRELAAQWAPWRGAAARLLWHGYARLKQKEGGGI